MGRVPVSSLDFQEVVDLLISPGRTDRPISVHFSTAHTVVEASRNARLLDILRSADIVAPDGMPLVWVGRLLGRRVTRVYGPDAMLALIDRARSQEATHYLFGGRPEVVSELQRRMESRFPGARFVGADSPPFRKLSPSEEQDTIERINLASPDFLWVGLGSPKQDLWIGEHLESLNARVVLGVGAAFDFHAGAKRQAPKWMQRSGLEWAFRLGAEPRRLWKRYTLVNVVFLSLLIRQAFTSLRRT